MKDNILKKVNHKIRKLLDSLKYNKVVRIGAVLLANTLLIILLLNLNNIVELPVTYECFSEIAKEGTYKIETVDDYITFAQTVNAGNDYKNCEIVLMEDLDFQNISQVPVIGLTENEKIIFLGRFNGNGHTLKGMKVVNPNGIAAMFADFAGTIFNLTIQDGYFEGDVCAGIAADFRSEGAIVNCRVDAELKGRIAGAFTGDFRGFLFNCVASENSLIGDNKGGYAEECYLEKDGKYISIIDENVVLDSIGTAQNLNAHLARCGDFHGISEMLIWSSENGLWITDEKAVLLKNVSTAIMVNGKEMPLNAYYSHINNHWCIALPPGYYDSELVIKAKNTKGKTERFKRNSGQETILYTDEQYQYFVDFLPIKDANTIMIDLSAEKTLDDIYQNKKTEFSGMISKIDSNGNIKTEYLKAIYGHGNDSWDADKKSFNLKFLEKTDIFGLGADEDYVLLAGYRDDSIMSYVTTTTMIQNLDFPYAHSFDLMNVYVEGEYLGVYFLVEKTELDENRLNISSVYADMKETLGDKLTTYSFTTWIDQKSKAEKYYYEIDYNPEDISGGYLLELDISDYDATASRFVTTHGNRITMKRAHYSSKEQVEYMSDYWQQFEDALYSESGYNQWRKHYSEYIDLESFAKQWLLYELVQENSMSSSVYFYKESELTGDGLLHACFPWDMEHSYLMYGPINEIWLSKSDTSNNYWSRFWLHEDFRKMVKKLWFDEFLGVVEQMVDETPTGDEKTMKNIRWYEERIGNISDMESSRWWLVNPYERCGTIREFLNIRIETLSNLLAEE